MVDHEENNNEPEGSLSPNMVARLRTAIANNPQRTTSFLVTTLLTICPALLTGPLLALLGFGVSAPLLVSLISLSSLGLSSSTDCSAQVVSLLASRAGWVHLGSSASFRALPWVDGVLH